jgi:transposase-like protein
MRQKSGPEKQPAGDAIRDIRRATRRRFSAEEKIRIVLEGLRGEESIAELCRREGIASSMYYGWSKEFLEAGISSAGVSPTKTPRLAADKFLEERFRLRTALGKVPPPLRICSASIFAALDAPSASFSLLSGLL